MPGISIHVVDVANGVVAEGMRIEVLRELPNGSEQTIATGTIGANGLLNAPELSATFSPGMYVAIFHVDAFYRSAGKALPQVPFLDVIRYRFGIAFAAQHYHLPMKLTPWGYSCFRGGA